MASSPFTHENFESLLYGYVNKQGSIDDLQQHPRCGQIMRDICYRFNFWNFEGVYGPEDLYQDAHVKLRKSGHVLQVEGNVLTEDDFKKWLFVLVRSVLRSKDRQLNKPRRNGQVRCDVPSVEFDRAAPDDNHEGTYFLSLFTNFVIAKRYPDERRRVIELWLNSFSLREIADALNKEGIDISYGTVRNWVEATLRDFKKSLGLRTPETRQERNSERRGA